MQISSHNQDEYRQQYQEKRPVYEAFALRLQDLLRELTQGANIPCDKIVHRVKTLESFLEKIERKLYTSPFEEIKDLAGVRVVTYYLDDVERVRQLIYQEFTVDEQHSVDKIMHLGAEEFGYRSVHLIISVSEPRASLHEWSSFAGLTAEIQIRTVLQHAWADLSHKIDYKITSQAPLELRRRLFRLSALLELADEEFTALRDEAEHIVSGYKQRMSHDELEIPVNLDSLREFIEQKVDLEHWEAFGVRAGMEPFPQIISRHQAIGLQILLLTLQTINMTTIAQFERLFEQFTQHQEQLEHFVEQVKAKGGSVHAVPVDVLIVLTSIVKARQIPADFDWGGKYEDFYIDALHEILENKNTREHENGK